MTTTGSPQFSDICVMRSPTSRLSNRRWRSSRRTSPDTPCWSARSRRCARPACSCSPTRNEATSARRWPPTPPPGRATRRWPSTPSPRRRTSASGRCAPFWTPPPPTSAACSCWPRRRIRRAPRVQRAEDRRAHGGAVDRGRRRGRQPQSAARARLRRCGGRRHRAVRPRPRRPRRAGARAGNRGQGGRAENLAGLGGAQPDQLLPAVSREVLRAGPDVGALRVAAERMRDAVAYLRQR